MKNSLITATARIRAQLFSGKLSESLLVRFSISTIDFYRDFLKTCQSQAAQLLRSTCASHVDSPEETDK